MAMATKFEVPQPLDEVAGLLDKYLVLSGPRDLPAENRDATTLWTTHTCLAHEQGVSPRLIVRSPTKGSGKTLLFEVIRPLVCDAQSLWTDATDASFYRHRRDHPSATILVDEIEHIFDGSGSRKALRALLNSGYRLGAARPLTVRGNTVTFDLFGPVALAGTGNSVPATLLDRGIVIDLWRRAPGERITVLNGVERKELEQRSADLQGRLAGWCALWQNPIIGHNPEIPAGITNRAEEIWRPLLAIADVAGGDWPERGRAACEALAQQDNPDPGERLLADIRTVFKQRGLPIALANTELLGGLQALPDAPWNDMRDFTVNRLAAMLAAFNIRTDQRRIGGTKARFYLLTAFQRAWERY